MAETDEYIFKALRGVVMLLGNDQLQDGLRDEAHYKESLGKMNMPESARGELLNLLTRVERQQELAVQKAIENAIPQSVTAAADNKYEKMQLETFDHIRISFWVALCMSIALFLIGLALLIVAVTQAVHESSVTTSTLTIAGLGLADFVLVFFRRPWQDVSVNLSNSQQVRTVATSYLAGLALLQRGDTHSLEILQNLTDRSVVMLEKYAEERDTDSKEDS